MRLVTTNLTYKEVQPKLRELVDTMFRTVPSGVGARGFVQASKQQFKEIISDGSKWCVENGYGWKEDVERTEGYGRIDWADPEKVSSKALERGIAQLGTLGSGNHYLEIQIVKAENIFDKEIAEKFGINTPEQVVVMVHCLPKSAKIFTEHGCWMKIGDLEKKWKDTNIKSMNIKQHNLEDTNIIKFFKLKPCGRVFKITTSTGKELVATEDHPILTPEGLKLLQEINIGEKVAVLPFEGVEYEGPSSDIIIDESDIRKIENNDKIINNLKKKGLLPLRFNSPKLPILTKLLGFLTGDGWLGKSKGRWSLTFIGKPLDLEKIGEDIRKIGFGATKVYSQNCKSNITFTDGKIRTIKGTTNTICIRSLSLPILLYAIGAPFGNKSRKEFEVPSWVFNAPLWIKRLYLASYFGAEMTRPNIRKKERYRFGNPTISLNKLQKLKSNGYKFLLQIRKLLEEFGIEVIKITEHIGILTKKGGKTLKLRLKISSKGENLKRLWSKIGFEYCTDRINLSAHSLQYLNLKDKLLEQEAFITSKPKSKLSVTSFSFRTVKYPTFELFTNQFKLNPPTPIIWDVIKSKKEIKDFNEDVYDFTVSHTDHNFIANGFITGNCGSRGFGHQIGTDYLRIFEDIMKRYNIHVYDRELACAPFQSKEGQDYYKAMACAANMAFANRQVILHRIREGFSKVFKTDAEKLEMHMVYDVAHNIAKLEEHEIDGKRKKLVVHRKGSTRAFPPNHPELANLYKETGQPVIIGGSMETGSFLLVGTQKAMDETFGSTAHGSGRTMSRAAAKHRVRGEQLQKDMEKRGIYVKATSMSGLAEEAGFAYKQVDEVIEACHEAGISKKVAKLIPCGNVKG